MRRPILILFVVSPVLLLALWHLSPWLALGATFVSHMLVLYPTLTPNSQWLGRVITRFATDEKEVWLTIDDGPNPETTPSFLRLLSEAGARATFFCTGRALREHRNLAFQIASDGHEIANHSDSHPSGSFWCLGAKRIAREIDRCDEVIRSIDRERRPIFRAPVGMKNPFVHRLLRQRNAHLVGWTTRGFDAVSNDPSAAVERIMRNVSPGSIILIHEGRVRRDGGQSVEVLRDLLARLSSEGYRCIVPSLERCLPPLKNQ